MPDKTISYLVDGHDRRVAKSVDGTIVTRYIWQSQYRLAAELNADGTMRKQFVYADGVNSPEYMIYQGKRYMFVKDHRGSVNLVVDVDSGNIEQKIEYSEFGEVLSDTNPGFQPFGFAGGLYDPDTKLVRFGARDFDGKLGRWLAKDPIRFDGGDENLYGYVLLNDPVNFVDYNGKILVKIVRIFVEVTKAAGKLLGDMITVCSLAPELCKPLFPKPFPKPEPKKEPTPPKPSCDPTRQSCPPKPEPTPDPNPDPEPNKCM